MTKILICGTRKAGYMQMVRDVLCKRLKQNEQFEIIEGCCPNSADAHAELFAKDYHIKVHHFPSHTGNYLKRNIEMVNFADEIIAFWDGFSYGTAHAIAQGVMKGVPVKIINILEDSEEKG